jgi:hypothetical protein
LASEEAIINKTVETAKVGGYFAAGTRIHNRIQLIDYVLGFKHATEVRSQ